MNMENIQFNRSAVNAVECVSKGWEIVKPNYLMFLAIGVIIVILGCIPIISWVLIGPLFVGVYAALLKQYRGENADFGTLFSGFSNFFPAFVMGFLLILPGVLLNSYSLALRIAQFLAIFDSSGLTGSAATVFTIVGFFINILALIASIIFGITFTLGLPLMTDKELPLMDAIKLSAKAGWANVGGLILLFLLITLILIAGVLACGIGIFFVLPVIYAAITVAYRQVFPDVSGGGPFNAPPPNNYGNMAGQAR